MAVSTFIILFTTLTGGVSPDPAAAAGDVTGYQSPRVFPLLLLPPSLPLYPSLHHHKAAPATVAATAAATAVSTSHTGPPPPPPPPPPSGRVAWLRACWAGCSAAG